MNANDLEDERNINLEYLIVSIFFIEEKEFYKNDIDIANYFIKKKI